jgi:hypothetical protein
MYKKQKTYTPDTPANALNNPDWRLATNRRHHMREREVIIDTEAEFTMQTELKMDFDHLMNHPDPTVRTISKRIHTRWWNTLNQHRECNLYREEMSFHEIERLNIATFSLALLRAIYRTGGDRRKYKFMGYSMSMMIRPLSYLIMGLIAKDHQGAHPGHLYTTILHDTRQLTDPKERRRFYMDFNAFKKKFFESSGLMTASTSYRTMTKRKLMAGKEFGTNHRLVLRPQARGLIEEFIDNFHQECQALSKDAILAKNEYIHNFGKITGKRVVNPMEDFL